MKLLQGFHSEDAARELQLRMERAGIAILVTTPLKVRNTDTGVVLSGTVMPDRSVLVVQK